MAERGGDAARRFGHGPRIALYLQRGPCRVGSRHACACPTRAGGSLSGRVYFLQRTEGAAP